MNYTHLYGKKRLTEKNPRPIWGRRLSIRHWRGWLWCTCSCRWKEESIPDRRGVVLDKLWTLVAFLTNTDHCAVRNQPRTFAGLLTLVTPRKPYRLARAQLTSRRKCEWDDGRDRQTVLRSRRHSFVGCGELVATSVGRSDSNCCISPNSTWLDTTQHDNTCLSCQDETCWVRIPPCPAPVLSHFALESSDLSYSNCTVCVLRRKKLDLDASATLGKSLTLTVLKLYNLVSA